LYPNWVPSVTETATLIKKKQINNYFFQIYTYGMLNQIATETGTQPYLNGRTKLILKNAFTPETFKIKILEEIYCNTK
jgi:hypothetical protein